MAKLEGLMGDLTIETKMPPKMPPGTSGKPVPLVTNSWRLNVEKKRPVYKYSVTMNEHWKRTTEIVLKELTKMTKDDYNEQLRKAKTVAVMNILIKEKLLPLALDGVAYDRASSLFSMKKVAPLVTKLSFTVLAKYGYTDDTNCDGVEVQIRPVNEDYSLTTDEAFKAAGDHNIIEWLALLTSQYVFNKPEEFVVYRDSSIFLYDPTQAKFAQEDVPALPDGKYLGIGASKAVSIVEGPGRKGCGPILTIDVLKTAFHYDEQPAHEKLAEMMKVRVNDLEKIYQRLAAKLSDAAQLFRGLSLHTTHTKKPLEVRLKKFWNGRQQPSFEIEGRKQTVAQYFAEKYQIKLKYPSYYLVDDKDRIFPLETLKVCPNQRVTFQQQTPEQMQKQIKACATLPAIRQRQTVNLAKAIKLDASTSNSYLKTQFTKIEEPVQVEGRLLDPPQLKGGSQNIGIENGCRWKGGRFAEARSPGKWALFLLLDEQDARKDWYNHANALVAALQKYGKEAGMQIERPVEIEQVDPTKLAWVFEDAKKEKIEYTLWLQSDRLHLHAELKALEQRHQLLAQDLRFVRTTELGKRDTFKNILMKMNCKLGGLSHKVVDTSRILNQRVLIIAVDFSHPAPTAPGKPPASPSVLGWSANCEREMQYFTGDFKFIRSRAADERSTIDGPLKEVFKEALSRFKKSQRNFPEFAVLYRGGVSEGQYPTLISTEVPLFEQAAREVYQGKHQPPLILIGVTKEHRHRLYPATIQGRSAGDQNVKPGTVVDTGIVSPARSEFFLNSHLAFQGTAKTPKYTILKNGNAVGNLKSMSEIQALTHALTFMHSIVNQTITLPVPLKVAAECAKRGNSNFRAESELRLHNGVGLDDVEMLNREMVYSRKELSSRRFNA